MPEDNIEEDEERSNKKNDELDNEYLSTEDVINSIGFDGDENEFYDDVEESLDYDYDEDDFEDIWEEGYESSSEYAPFQNLNDNDLLQLLDLPDDDVPGMEDALSSFKKESRNTVSIDADDDFSLLDDPDEEELIALEEALRMLEEEDDNMSRNDNIVNKLESSKDNSALLEKALLEGVVPAGAGVGSNCLPGDYGFDPFDFATKDYFRMVQRFLLSFLPADIDEEENVEDFIDEYSEPRPTALILRDYREAEIRHGRLAMLAAIFWPLQEIVDKLFIPTESAEFTVIYGGVTLPFLSLFMTIILLLLGYLDIYAKSIKEMDTGEAFLPGECFWDPLKILDGATDSAKRKMQERELNNGRFAMIAVALYILEEAIFQQPLISLSFNQILFEPAFEIPAVQEWLDRQFQGPSTIYPSVKSVDFVEFIDAVETVLDEEAGIQ